MLVLQPMDVIMKDVAIVLGIGIAATLTVVSGLVARALVAIPLAALHRLSPLA